MPDQTAEPGKIRLFIVDDTPETRDNLRKLLLFEADIEVVGAAPDGETAIHQARELQPDVALLDVNLPGMDGIAAGETIRQQVPACRVIIMSVEGERALQQQARLAGASAVLLKPFSTTELVTTIRQVYQPQR
jgi:pilus assembly protein CpaE